MENFDANTDCITGAEVSANYILRAGVAKPFDDNKRNGQIDWAYAAALGILKDLPWRNGIGKALKDCDIDTRRALVERLSQIAYLAYDDGMFMNPQREIRIGLHEKLDEVNVALAAARATIDEQEAHLSELSLNLQDERSKRIFAQQDLDDTSELEKAQARNLNARTTLLELEAEEKRGKISTLEDQLSEAVAKADIADYSRECVAARCKELEAKVKRADEFKETMLCLDGKLFPVRVRSKDADRLDDAMKNFNAANDAAAWLA